MNLEACYAAHKGITEIQWDMIANNAVLEMTDQKYPMGSTTLGYGSCDREWTRDFNQVSERPIFRNDPGLMIATPGKFLS